MARLRPLAAAAVLVAAAASAGCAAGRARPPFPADAELAADPGAAYCLVCTPPTYRDVPHVVACPSKCVTERVFRREVCFEEVCVPGGYQARCAPCREDRQMEVVVEPGRTEWVEVPCPGECGPCYRPVRIPPVTRWCPVVETEGGLEYCVYTPPRYDVVAHMRTVALDVPRYVPGDVEVRWCREPFMPPQVGWRKRYDCDACPCPSPCPPRRGDFAVAPSRD